MTLDSAPVVGRRVPIVPLLPHIIRHLPITKEQDDRTIQWVPNVSGHQKSDFFLDVIYFWQAEELGKDLWYDT